MVLGSLRRIRQVCHKKARLKPENNHAETKWLDLDFAQTYHIVNKGDILMKTKIIRMEKGKEGVILPEEFLRHLALAPGSEVELAFDKKKKWIIIRPMHGDDFLEHFKDSMESMA